MSLQMQFIGQLLACIAYLLLAYAFFVLAERLKSGNAKVAAIAFAYCGVGLFAQLVASLGHYLPMAEGLGSIGDSALFHLIVGGLRPFALLLAAICTVRLAKAQVGAV